MTETIHLSDTLHTERPLLQPRATQAAQEEVEEGEETKRSRRRLWETRVQGRACLFKDSENLLSREDKKEAVAEKERKETRM